MTGSDNAHSESKPGLQQVPVAWEALEDAFENNAPDVHSFLNTVTGDVVRVVDGVADPAVVARMSRDSTYMRIDPVSSREQYRWMERYIATLDVSDLHTALMQAIDGKGAFRRFKDVLMAHPEARERWFTFRSEHLRSAMDAWLEAHGIEGVVREVRELREPATSIEVNAVAKPAAPRQPATPIRKASPRTQDSHPDMTRSSVAASNEARPEGLASRQRLHALAATLPSAQLETAVAFLEFIANRKSATAPAAVEQGSASVGPGGETADDEADDATQL